MKSRNRMVTTVSTLAIAISGIAIVSNPRSAPAQANQSSSLPPSRGQTSYLPVTDDDFPTVMQKMSAAKPEIMQRQQNLLSERYDLSDRPAQGVTMGRGKAVRPNRKPIVALAIGVLTSMRDLMMVALPR